MTDFGESASVDVLLDNHDEDCYFCTKKSVPKSKKNVLKQNFDEDSLIGLVPGGIEHENNSGTLGTNCASTHPSPLRVQFDDWEEDLPVEFAAHHLIPGDASLQKSKLFRDADYGLQIEGEDEGNVGYDVNNTTNGVWLTGNYAYSQRGKKRGKRLKSQWGEDGETFERVTGIPAQEYVDAAIEFSGAQFHDAHTDYNEIVRKKLDQIYDKLEKFQDVPWCPEAAKTKKAKKEPLYTLVNRLASLSLNLRSRLTFPTKHWKYDLYTSGFSESWMKNQDRNRTRRRSL